MFLDVRAFIQCTITSACREQDKRSPNRPRLAGIRQINFGENHLTDFNQKSAGKTGRFGELLSHAVHLHDLSAPLNYDFLRFQKKNSKCWCIYFKYTNCKWCA